MPPVQSIFRLVTALPPGPQVIPHGLYNGDPSMSWASVLVNIVETADVNGFQSIDVTGWDETNLYLENIGALPQPCEIEAVALYRHLGLFNAVADMEFRNMQRTVNIVPPGGSNGIGATLRDHGVGVPYTHCVVNIAGIGPAGGPQCWIENLDTYAFSIHQLAGALAPVQFTADNNTFHSKQRAHFGMDPDNCLMSVNGPVTIDGGDSIALPHGIVEAGNPRIPDLCNAVICGGPAKDVPIVAPTHLLRPVIGAVESVWENLRPPGEPVTIQVYNLYLWSGGRTPYP
ncbi:MAG: hypothetical protein K0U84_14020 [Actinomycetia bacterium]|nr:hypothetical protein [Actinomycetes bacterium]